MPMWYVTWTRVKPVLSLATIYGTFIELKDIKSKYSDSPCSVVLSTGISIILHNPIVKSKEVKWN